jgi:hypothetical protein
LPDFVYKALPAEEEEVERKMDKKRVVAKMKTIKGNRTKRKSQKVNEHWKWWTTMTTTRMRRRNWTKRRKNVKRRRRSCWSRAWWRWW